MPTDNDTPDDETPPEQTPQTEEDAAAALHPVASFAVRRALALAGGRLVSHRQRDRYPGCAKHALHVRHGPVDRPRADALLANAWEDLHAVADDLLVDPHEFQELLHGFAAELLREVLRRATFGRAPVAVGA